MEVRQYSRTNATMSVNGKSRLELLPSCRWVRRNWPTICREVGFLSRGVPRCFLSKSTIRQLTRLRNDSALASRTSRTGNRYSIISPPKAPSARPHECRTSDPTIAHASYKAHTAQAQFSVSEASRQYSYPERCPKAQDLGHCSASTSAIKAQSFRFLHVALSHHKRGGNKKETELNTYQSPESRVES